VIASIPGGGGGEVVRFGGGVEYLVLRGLLGGVTFGGGEVGRR